MCLWVPQMSSVFFQSNNVRGSANTRGQPTRRATARVPPGAGADVSGRLFCAGTAEEAIALGTSWVAGAAPKPHAGNSDGDTAMDLVSEVVAWSVLVWFAGQREMKNWAGDGLVIFMAPRMGYSVLGAVGPRVATAPMALSLGSGGSHL